MVRYTVIVLLCLVSVCVAKMSYKVGELSEEENTVYGSRFLTDSQKCDGCSAIAYQVHLSFESKHKNRPESLGEFPSHEIIETLGKIIFVESYAILKLYIKICLSILLVRKLI